MRVLGFRDSSGLASGAISKANHFIRRLEAPTGGRWLETPRVTQRPLTFLVPGRPRGPRAPTRLSSGSGNRARCQPTSERNGADPDCFGRYYLEKESARHGREWRTEAPFAAAHVHAARTTMTKQARSRGPGFIRGPEEGFVCPNELQPPVHPHPIFPSASDPAVTPIRIPATKHDVPHPGRPFPIRKSPRPHPQLLATHNQSRAPRAGSRQ